MSRFGQDAAALRGYIGSLKAIALRIEEIDGSLYDEGLPYMDDKRQPLAQALVSLEDLRYQLDLAAKALVAD